MKEWRLLARDRVGLLMLFLMPALLVIVISVVQMNVLKTMGDDPVALLWVDRDQGEMARLLRERVAAVDGIDPVDRVGHKPLNEDLALQLVAEGDYQACLVIPPDFTRQVQARAATAAEAMLAPEGGAPMEKSGHP